MKLINTLSGGYRRVMDTLLGLQTEMITGINAPFASLGYDLVLSGCAVTNNGNGTVTIAPGLMYIAGNTLRFDGASNVSTTGMAIVASAPVTSVPWPFADGSTKNLYSEQKAIVGVRDLSNPFQLKISTSLYNLQQYIKDQINAAEIKGTIKEIYDLDGTFGANFDPLSGLGITTAWTGWSLDNGNNGTPGSAGMTLIGSGTYTDPSTGLQTTYSYGDFGGEVNHTLTIGEMPSHGHGYIKTQGGIDFGNGSTRDSNTNTSGATTDTAGSGESHNNMMPYKVVYRVVKIV